MPAKRKITRTIKTAEVTVLCLDTITAEPFNETINLPGDVKTEDKMMKLAREKIDNDSVKAVKIVNVNIVETLWAMSEEDFIANAKPLPPRKTTNEN